MILCGEQDLTDAIDILEIDRNIRIGIGTLILQKQYFLDKLDALQDTIDLRRYKITGNLFDPKNIGCIRQYFLDQMDMIDELASIDGLRYKILFDLHKIKSSLEEKISILNCWNFYMLATIPILYRYLELINVPISVDIFNRSAHIDDINSKKGVLIKQFLKIIDFLLPQYKSLYISNLSYEYPGMCCYNCNNTNFDKYDDIYICKQCYVEIIYTTYNSADNMKILRYNYDRKMHFKECMDQFQAKQNTGINMDLLVQLKHQLANVNLTDYSQLTKPHILFLLKELGYSKNYEDCNLIHHKLTGQPANDISYLENRLLNDFDILSEQYDNMMEEKIQSTMRFDFKSPESDREDSGRKSFINMQYVLIQLLHKNKYSISNDDIQIMVKSIDNKSSNIDICQTIFNMLGWSYLHI